MTVGTYAEVKNVEVNVERTALLDELKELRLRLVDIGYKSFSRTKRDDCIKLGNYLLGLLERQEAIDTVDLRTTVMLVRSKVKNESSWDKYNTIGLGLIFIAFIGNAAGGLIRLLTWLLN